MGNFCTRLRNILCRITVISLLVFISSSAFALDESVRCVSFRSDGGSVMVCVGASMFDAKVKAGDPDYRTVTGISGYTEVWYYNCGDGQFGRDLVFQGGRLVSIRRSEDRGSGLQRCW